MSAELGREYKSESWSLVGSGRASLAPVWFVQLVKLSMGQQQQQNTSVSQTAALSPRIASGWKMGSAQHKPLTPLRKATQSRVLKAGHSILSKQ